jgi:hypothetical protein
MQTNVDPYVGSIDSIRESLSEGFTVTAEFIWNEDRRMQSLSRVLLEPEAR